MADQMVPRTLQEDPAELQDTPVHEDDGTAEPTSSKGVHEAGQKLLAIDAEIRVDELEDTTPVIGGKVFQAVVTSLILLNTVQLGLEADHPEWTVPWMVCEHFFAAGFLLETLIKIWYLHHRYFHSAGNLFDFVLVCIGVLDAWIMPGIKAAFGGSLDLRPLSSLRLLRMTRIFRALRLLKIFRPLILIFEGVAAAFRATFWVSIVLCIAIYICSIFCVELLGRTSDIYPAYTEEMEVIDETEMMQNFNPYLCFGSMTKSMLTLFSVAVGAEWPEVVRPIMVKQPMLVLCFVGFVLFVALGIMNIIVALIVDQVVKAAAELDRMNFAELKHNQKKVIKEIQAVVFAMDHDGDGEVSADELRDNWHTDLMQTLLTKINLPHGCTPEELVAILDDDGDGALAPDEFTASIFRLIEGNDFQHRCMLKMSTNQIKTHLKSLRQNMNEVSKESQATHEEVHRCMREMRQEMHHGFRQLLQTYAPECEPASPVSPPILQQNTLWSKDTHTQSRKAETVTSASAAAQLQAVESTMANLALQVAEVAVARAVSLASRLQDDSIKDSACNIAAISHQPYDSLAFPGLAARGDVKESLRCRIQEALTQLFVVARGQLTNGSRVLEEKQACGRILPQALAEPDTLLDILPLRHGLFEL